MHQEHYKTSAISKYQQGVTLIEVLVSMLLMAIIGFVPALRHVHTLRKTSELFLFLRPFDLRTVLYGRVCSLGGHFF